MACGIFSLLFSAGTISTASAPAGACHDHNGGAQVRCLFFIITTIMHVERNLYPVLETLFQ